MFGRLAMVYLLAVGAVSAQRGGGMGGTSGGGMGGDDMSGMNGNPVARSAAAPKTKFELIADRLKLNKDQKEQTSKIFAAAQEESSAFNQQADEGRKAITQALLSGASGDDVNKLLGQYTGIIAQQTAVEAKAYGKLYALLDAKQQAKAPAVFAELMPGLFARDWKRATSPSSR